MRILRVNWLLNKSAYSLLDLLIFFEPESEVVRRYRHRHRLNLHWLEGADERLAKDY